MWDTIPKKSRQFPFIPPQNEQDALANLQLPTILWQNAAYSQVNVQQHFKLSPHLWLWSIT